MSKNNSYKDISRKLGWKDQKVPTKAEPPTVNTEQPKEDKPKTTVKPKSGGQGSEI